MGRWLPAVLREEPRYRLLFAGQVLSVIGDRITFIALPFAVLAIGDLSDLAIVTAALSLPFLVVAIPGGSVADRFGRRETMLVADLGRAVVQATMAALLLTGTAEIWMLAVLAAMFGTCESFFGPALVGLIPQTVETARLHEANALFGLVDNTGMVLGPALAGILIALTGPGEAIALDALTFLASAAFLARLRSGDPGRRGGRGAAWRAVRPARGLGDRALVELDPARHRSARRVHGLRAALGLRARAGDRRAGDGRRDVVGGVAGSVIVYRVRFDRTLVVVFGAMLLAASQGGILASGLDVGVIAALECLTGVGVTIFFTGWDLTVQQQVAPEATARISAYDWAAAVGLMPIGVLLSSPLAEAIGVHETMRLGSVVGIAAALACLAVPAVRAVRRPLDGARRRQQDQRPT